VQPAAAEAVKEMVVEEAKEVSSFRNEEISRRESLEREKG